MSFNWVEDIAHMHMHYGIQKAIKKLSKEQLRANLRFRIMFLEEELEELRQAESYGDADGIVDALIDLCVVAIGTLDQFEVDGELAWDEVLKANLNKEVGIKASRPNPLGLPDLIKPFGWKAPSHKDNLGMLENLFSDQAST